MARPMYEALDTQGIPYLRQAEFVHELPTAEDRLSALAEATPVIAERLKIKQIDRVKVGTPVFCAFEGMTRASAKNHREAKLLLTHGGDVPLLFCPSYN